MAASGKGQGVDLDLFLTAVEGKLRGPFTSVELTKTVTTTALRGANVSEVQYLQQIAQILNKSEKIIQMRILIGLLGLDPEIEMNQVIYSLLRQAQGKGENLDFSDMTEEEKLAQRYEEWVRVVAGLIQGIMFKTDDGTDTQNYGEEIKGLLEASCDEIIEKVDDLAQEVATKKEQQDEEREADPAAANEVDTSLLAVDVDPLMAPYKYSLLNPNLLETTIPQATSNKNPHFAVNESANILTMDAKMEEAKALEEAEHAFQKQQIVKRGGVNPSASRAGGNLSKRGAVMPGMRKTNRDSSGSAAATAAKKKAAARPKSSLFITKKPAAAAANAKKTVHVRKKGAIQGLVGKGRQLQPGGAVARAGGGAGAAMRLGGRALKTSASSGGAPRSRMKMIDDSEAVNLAKQKQDDAGGPLGRARKLAGLKRKGMASVDAGRAKAMRLGRSGNAKARGAKSMVANASSAMQQPEDDDEEPESQTAPASPPEGQANALAAAALSKYAQQQEEQQTANHQSQASAANDQQAALAAAALSKYQTQMRGAGAPQPSQNAAGQVQGNGPRQLNWQQLLNEKSNKLTPQDRLRIQHFFENRSNPTPGQVVYKMKLHEERGTDPNTGKEIKETYYLELNYQNFTSKQSKKVKRYD